MMKSITEFSLLMMSWSTIGASVLFGALKILKSTLGRRELKSFLTSALGKRSRK